VKTKILLVDDSKFLRLATERALAKAGYDVVTASDGEQALETARACKPDVILLDMLLPKMTGPDVLKALKKDPETAGIAVVCLRGCHRGMRGVCSRMERRPTWRNRSWRWTTGANGCCPH